MLRHSTTTEQIETSIKQLSTCVEKGEMGKVFAFLRKAYSDFRTKTKPDFVLRHPNKTIISKILEEIIEQFHKVKNEYINSVKKQSGVNTYKLEVAGKNVKDFLAGVINEIEGRLNQPSQNPSVSSSASVNASVSSSPRFFQARESSDDVTKAANALMSISSSAMPAVRAPSSISSAVTVSGTPTPTPEDCRMVQLRYLIGVSNEHFKKIDTLLSRHQQLKNKLHELAPALCASLEDQLKAANAANELYSDITNDFTSRTRSILTATQGYAEYLSSSCNMIEAEIKRADEEAASRPDKRARSI